MTTMSYALDRQAKWFLFGTALLLSLVFLVAFPGVAKADVAGDFKFTISAQSGGGAISEVAVSIACTGGAITGVGTTSATGTLFATPPAGASCGAGDSYIAYALEKSGMVTLIALPGGTHETDELNAVTSTMLYQVKVIVTDNEGTAFTHSTLDTITLNSIAASTTLGGASLFGNTGSGIQLSVLEDGYVSATSTNPGLISISPVSSTQTLITFASSTSVGTAIGSTATSTIRGLAFSHIVKALREGDSMPIAGAALVSAGGVTCNEESTNTGTYFCPVPFAGDGGTDDITIGQTAYVTNITGDTPNRSGTADAAATTTVSSIQFAHKITIVNELGNAVTPNYVRAGDIAVDCMVASNVAYCEVGLTSDNNASTGSFRIFNTSYVSTSVELGSNRASSNTVQGAVVMTSTNGVRFANKVTLFGGANLISGATVTAGDGLATTCSESGTTAVYYCATPVSDSSRTTQFVKAGFTTRQDNFATDRTTTTDAQVALTYNQFQVAPSGGTTDSFAKPVITSITLGDGSGTTATKDIKITIVGSNILRYKIALTQAGLTTAEYPQYGGVPISYTLSAGDGVKTLWFQFMSSTGGETTATSKTITLSATAATPATPAVPAVPPKVSVPVVLLIDLPRVPTVITPISAKPMAPDFTPVSIATLADGDLFMIEDATAGASVYWFTGGYKRPFASEKAFMSWFPSFDRISIKRVKKDEITYLAWGPSMPYKPGSKLIKVPDDVKTYSIQADGSLCHVKDEVDAAKLFGANWNKRVDDMPVSQLLGTYKIKDQCVVAS